MIKISKILFLGLVILFLNISVMAQEAAIPIKVLILPKFEVAQMYGDFPGEAQYYYEAFLMDSDEYEIRGPSGKNKLYVKDGIAMYVTGMGKVNAALSTMAVLSDSRFDFSEAYVLSTGCAGSAVEYSVMGDVFLVTAVIDFDLGHHADSREMLDPSRETWFHDSNYDDDAYFELDPDLMNRVYELIKDIEPETTEKTRNYMNAAFEGADWAVRDPMVLRGTTVTSDNYWKGIYDHQNALLMVETYGAPDPFALTEMEEISVTAAVKRMGMADRLIILRDSVNMDVFVLGNSPESLWDPNHQNFIASDDNIESADIFPVAMENNFRAGALIIQAILDGNL